MLYALGSNSNGQLGIGHNEDVCVPTRCIGLPTNESLVKVIAGGNHSACLTLSGRVFLTGDYASDHVQCQTMTYSEPDILRRQVWKDIACGWAFTLLVDQEGHVYGLGKGHWGELGGGCRRDSQGSLIALEGLSDVVSVACGWRHALALNCHGDVFGWGWNRYGQVGEGGKMTDVQRLTLPEPIIHIACGHLHSFFLGRTGQVFGLGSNKHDQLQIPVTPLVTITSGWHSGAGLSQEGELVTWGRHSYDLKQYISQRSISQLACGSEHCLVLLQDAQTVIASGWNEHGNCGPVTGATAQRIHLPHGKVTLIAAGCATTWIDVSTCTTDD